MGSQFRYGVIADIAYALDENGEIGYNIEGRGEVSPEEFKQHFEEVIAENIEEDLTKVAKSLGVGKGSIVE
jgi:hypothetical protein